MMMLRDFIRKYRDELKASQNTIYYYTQKYRSDLINEGILRPHDKIGMVFYEVVDEKRLYEFLMGIKERTKRRALATV